MALMGLTAMYLLLGDFIFSEAERYTEIWKI